MSNQTGENGTEWVALAADTIQSAGRDADATFRLLYEPPPNPDYPSAFVPLYALPNAGAPVVERTAGTEGGSDEDETDPQELQRSGYAEGFAKGEADGLSAGKQEIEKQIDRMTAILKEMEGLWPQLIQTHEGQLISLICRIAEKVVLGQVAVDHEAVKRVILDAFRMVPEPVDVTIELHPDDAQYIETVKEDFFQTVKALKHMSLFSDPSVQPGGCRLKTRLGQVDATLETRLEAVSKTVMRVCQSRIPDGTRT